MDDWDPKVTNGFAAERDVILFDYLGIGRSSGETPSTVAAGVLPVLTTGVKKVFHELYLSFVSSQPFFGEMISLSLETGSGNLSRFWKVYSYIFNDGSDRSFVIGKKILIIKG